MSKNIVGIDPGITGAVAIKFQSNLITVEDTPTEEVKKAKGMRLEYMPVHMASVLSMLDKHNTHVFIESVHAMPGQGVTSMFNFGKGYGMWLGILAALNLPYTCVTPQSWKKMLMAGVSDKDAARGRALQLYPAMLPLLRRKKDIGRADALLIMHYGERISE